MLFILTFCVCAICHSVEACELPAPISAITDISKTHIRKGPGEWAAARPNDRPHGGVDLVANASYPDKVPYTVNAIAGGIIAYSVLNGSEITGYGNLIVIDHGKNCYSLYAHLSNLPFTPIRSRGNLLKHVGDKIRAGEFLGFFVDIKSDLDSIGSAGAVASDNLQHLHFEIIDAPSGRTGPAGLVDAIFRADGVRENPTPVLERLGYQIRD